MVFFCSWGFSGVNQGSFCFLGFACCVGEKWEEGGRGNQAFLLSKVSFAMASSVFFCVLLLISHSGCFLMIKKRRLGRLGYGDGVAVASY